MILKEKNYFLRLNIWMVLLLFSGCTPIKFTSMTPKQPIASEYSLSRNVDTSAVTSIDTNCIYVFEGDLHRTYQSGKSELVHTYKYLKFNGNRVALYSNDSRTPITPLNMTEINGAYSYYRIKGDELEFELYDVAMKKFFIWYGKIYPDRIHFYRERIRVFTGGKGKLDITYYKKPTVYPGSLIWPE